MNLAYHEEPFSIQVGRPVHHAKNRIGPANLRSSSTQDWCWRTQPGSKVALNPRACIRSGCFALHCSQRLRTTRIRGIHRDGSEFTLPASTSAFLVWKETSSVRFAPTGATALGTMPHLKPSDSMPQSRQSRPHQNWSPDSWLSRGPAPDQ